MLSAAIDWAQLMMRKRNKKGWGSVVDSGWSACNLSDWRGSGGGGPPAWRFQWSSSDKERLGHSIHSRVRSKESDSPLSPFEALATLEHRVRVYTYTLLLHNGWALRLNSLVGGKLSQKVWAQRQRGCSSCFIFPPFFFSRLILDTCSGLALLHVLFFFFFFARFHFFPPTLMDHPYSHSVASSLTHDMFLLKVESLPDSRSSS